MPPGSGRSKNAHESVDFCLKNALLSLKLLIFSRAPREIHHESCIYSFGKTCSKDGLASCTSTVG